MKHYTHKMFRIARHSIFFLALVWGTAGLHAQSVVSYKTGTRYVSEGTIATDGWYDHAVRLTLDYDSYSSWVLRYMDGNDPESADDWVHFTRFVREETDTLVLYYDMNLPWPMNRSDNRAVFSITRIDEPEADTHELVFSLENPPFGLHEGSLVITLSPEVGARFRIELRLWGLLDLFMNTQEFRAFMEDKTRRIAQNMRDTLSAAPVADL